MLTYKEKLSSAINSVLSDIRSLSEKEFEFEIEKNLYDDRTNAIFYAWDDQDDACFSQSDGLYELQDIPYVSERSDVSFVRTDLSYDMEVIFCPQDFKRVVTKDKFGYQNIVTSDEYCFMAAA